MFIYKKLIPYLLLFLLIGCETCKEKERKAFLYDFYRNNARGYNNFNEFFNNVESIKIWTVDMDTDRIKQLNQFPQLKELRLSSIFFNNAQWHQIGSIEKIKKLVLRGHYIDRDLRHIGYTKIEHLELSFSKITDKGIDNLINSETKIKILDIAYSKITDKAIDEILKSPTPLVALGVYASYISDKSIPNLSKMKSLKQLDIRETHITKEGFEKLKQALPNCEIISDFNKKKS